MSQFDRDETVAKANNVLVVFSWESRVVIRFLVRIAQPTLGRVNSILTQGSAMTLLVTIGNRACMTNRHTQPVFFDLVRIFLAESTLLPKKMSLKHIT